MKERIEERLSELQAELESGRIVLAELDQRKAGVEETLLRISGAIQVLQELLAASEPPVDAAEPMTAQVT